MTDIKKLMLSEDPACVRTPIDISPVALSVVSGLRRIRATGTHRLLAYYSNQGILLHDSRSKLQHILTREQIIALFTDSNEG